MRVTVLPSLSLNHGRESKSYALERNPPSIPTVCFMEQTGPVRMQKVIVHEKGSNESHRSAMKGRRRCIQELERC